MMSIFDRTTEAPGGRLASEDPMATYTATRTPKMEPAYPGAILRDDVIPALGISVTEAAAGLGISRQMLHQIMAGTKPVTPAMALRIGKFVGNGPEIWLAMQQSYDLWHARRELGKEIDAIRTRRAPTAGLKGAA